MKLKAVTLENFRCYQRHTRIELGDFTAFIGKNDFGKSSILEALEIFFNGELVKIDKSDLSVRATTQVVKIGCIFSNLPDEIIIDVDAKTTLRAEYLLNADRDLEIVKEYDCSKTKVSEAVVAVAMHPADKGFDDLLLVKNPELKKRLKDKDLDKAVDQRSNVAMRQAIWKTLSKPKLVKTCVPLDEEGAKQIWDQLQKSLPVYALFQSDRKSLDEDNEVQDPMKLAVKEAIKSVQKEIEGITSSVRERATAVANETLQKLREMDAELATKLLPVFKTEPKWDTIFKLALTGDENIPINKRGSGVRRLILLNFFRAAAERKRAGNEAGIIYAIEEPETSQHPSSQEMLIKALRQLTEYGDRQVFITTHVPALAGLVSTDDLRHVTRDADGHPVIRQGDKDTLKQIADDLGVLPNPAIESQIRVIICVEGKHDVAFLTHTNRILRTRDANLLDLTDPRLLVLPLGGSNLKDWVEYNRLQALGKPEVHIYDRGANMPPKYQQQVNAVNARGNGSWAVLTTKSEAENYIHPSAIKRVMNVDVTVQSDNDVPSIVARAVHETSNSPVPWDALDLERKESKESQAKSRLNNEVVAGMNYEELTELDANGEIEGWFQRIGAIIQ